MRWLLLPILFLAAFQPMLAKATNCNRVCGNRPLALSQGSSLRIIGGTDALPGTWPWAVSLQFPTRKGWSHFCGGSLINSRWVVSSAFCFRIKKFLKVEYFRVQLGATQHSKPGPDAQVRKIKRLVEHEKFAGQRHNFDISLIELSEPVICNHYIQPACLPDPNLKKSALNDCYTCGWGIKEMKFYGRAPNADILQETAVELLPGKVCNSSRWYFIGIRDDNICAISDEAYIDNCRGDGGSPLMCKQENSQRFWVIGISSWGSGCDRQKAAGVFTSTQSYYHWIQKILKNPPQSALLPPFKPTARPRPTTVRIYPTYQWTTRKTIPFRTTTTTTTPLTTVQTTRRYITRTTWKWPGSMPAWWYATLPPKYPDWNFPTHKIIRGTKKWVRPAWLPPPYTGRNYWPNQP
ncbi:acrosin-like [Elgaria multicarinata webbii]|uniref:acrosin-like n=1 Tax=Elgaria multicarinata webbii TaxID=159646 RepID=UPI002FCCD00C